MYANLSIRWTLATAPYVARACPRSPMKNNSPLRAWCRHTPARGAGAAGDVRVSAPRSKQESAWLTLWFILAAWKRATDAFAPMTRRCRAGETSTLEATDSASATRPLTFFAPMLNMRPKHNYYFKSPAVEQ